MSIYCCDYVGEPFCRRDVQFQNPDIGVSRDPAIKKIRNFLFYFSIFYGYLCPVSHAIKARKSLKKRWILPFFASYQQN